MLDLGEYIEDRAVTTAFVYRRLNQETAEIYEWLEASGDVDFAWGERKQLIESKGWQEANFLNAKAARYQGAIDRVPRFLPLSKELAVLVGYYLSEGSRKGAAVSFALHLAERELAQEIEGAVLSMGFRGVSHYERPEQNGRDVVIEDVILSEFLISLCGEGFAEKRIPAILAEAADALMLSMLRTLFTGDGCDFKTDTNRVALKLANPSMIIEARRLLLSFGVIGGVLKEEPTDKTLFKTTTYCLYFNGESAEYTRRLLAGDTRPFTGFQKSGVFRGDYVLLRLDGIEVVGGISEVIGFQMADDRSFCVAGVATHNTTINLLDWRDQVAMEIARWRMDNNYIPIMPLPLGNQTIGGDGKALLMSQEMQMLGEQIIMGMGVPREFLQGGLSYAGTNVSMRMLENMFLSFIGRHRQMANWVMNMVAHYLGWPKVNVRFKPFKMADDLQRKSYLFQLNQANKISDTTLLSDADLDIEEENDIMIQESSRRLAAVKKQQLAMAEIQGESQTIMMKMQAKAQQAMQAAQTQPSAPGEPGGPQPGPLSPDQSSQLASSSQNAAAQMPPPSMLEGPPGEGAGSSVPVSAQSSLSQEQDLGTEQGKEKMPVDLVQMARMYAEQIVQLHPDMQDYALNALSVQSQELGDLVKEFLTKLQQEQAQGTTPSGVDMRPLPDKLPPRRAGALV